MQVHHYHHDTGVYLGSSIADESPLEEGVYLIPAFATTVQVPSIPDGSRAVFDGTEWVIEAIPDPLPAEPQPEKTAEELAAEALAEKKALRQSLVDTIQVTTSTNKTFDGDETSQDRMTRAILTAQIAGITETTWVLANNVPTLINLDELREALALSMQAQSAVWSAPYEN